MLTFKQLQEKKTKIKINPKQDDLKEKKIHSEDCTCGKCEKKEDKEGPVVEAKVDAGKSPETKEKDRNVRKFGVSHNVAGHGKLRRALHRSNRGDKKIPGDKPYVEKESVEREGEMVEGSAYGLYKGDGKPKGAMAAFAKKKERHPRDQKELDRAQAYIKKNPKFGVKEGADIADILARLEKKRISKGGNPEDSPLPAMKKYHADKKKVKKEEVELEEERAARKMTLRNLQTLKKKTIPAAQAAEKKRKKEGKGEYSAAYKKKETDVTNYDDKAPAKKKAATVKKATPKPKAKKKEAPRTQKGAMAYDGPNKERSQAADRVKAKTKAKQKSLPKKEAPKKKSSLSDKARDFIKKGVKRHRKATQGARVFGKGVKAGAKKAVKFAKDVKKVVSEQQTFQQFQEATRLKKEKGYDKGGTKKPSGKKDAALAFVLDKIKKEHGASAVVGQGSRQSKKVKGAKSTAGTGKYKKAADQKKQTASDAKKRGFKSSQDYVNTMARYGGKDNYDKGRGLGT